MKKKLSILLICSLCFILVGCNSSGSSGSTSNISNDTVIMTLSTSGGGAMTYEMMEESSNKYTITYGGSITDKNNITKQMSDSDISTMRNYYIKFCNHDIKTEESQIMDGPTYKVIVTDKMHDFSNNATIENTYEYRWSFDRQDECVHELTNLVEKYFN